MKRLYTEDNIDELNTNIEAYFELCENADKNKKEHPCFSGLAYSLGFSSRQSLHEYAKRDDATSLPIKRAMLKIEWSYEIALHSQSCTGAIFALKNRGWTDKSEIEHSGEVEYKINPPPSYEEAYPEDED